MNNNLEKKKNSNRITTNDNNVVDCEYGDNIQQQQQQQQQQKQLLSTENTPLLSSSVIAVQQIPLKPPAYSTTNKPTTHTTRNISTNQVATADRLSSRSTTSSIDNISMANNKSNTKMIDDTLTCDPDVHVNVEQLHGSTLYIKHYIQEEEEQEAIIVSNDQNNQNNQIILDCCGNSSDGVATTNSSHSHNQRHQHHGGLISNSIRNIDIRNLAKLNREQQDDSDGYDSDTNNNNNESYEIISSTRKRNNNNNNVITETEHSNISQTYLLLKHHIVKKDYDGRYNSNNNNNNLNNNGLFTFHMKSGSLQQSVIIAIVIAIVNGIACFIYYEALEYTLHYIWHIIPNKYIIPSSYISEQYYWIYIPLVIFIGAILNGVAVIYLGEPGDMAYTVSCVHSDKAYIPLHHVLPMIVTSFVSIVFAAASLGPEAPLVAICGALAGWVSRSLFHEKHGSVIRKHTLMGMAGALSAFFGVPLGGSLFALEVNSRFGLEYYEHVAESIFCGELTLIIFRTLTNESTKALWDYNIPKLEQSEMWHIALGGILGLLGAFLAYIFALFHTQIMYIAHNKLNILQDNNNAIYRALFGIIGIILTGIYIPQTLFWSENEIQYIATRSPACDLPHIWPTTGLIQYEMDTILKTLLVGFIKLIAISFTIAGGFRGGFIFPLIMAGSAIGRALSDYTNNTIIPIQLGIMCVAAGINVAITRTALATTLVLTFLSGELYANPAVLMASLCSLFATGYLIFIKTQLARSDIDHSIFHKPTQQQHHHHIDDDSERHHNHQTTFMKNDN